MDSNKVQNHFHLGDIGASAMLLLVGLAGGAFLLYRGLESGNVLAIILTTALVVLTLLGLGAGATLFILNTAARREEKRSLVEQERWRDNAQENIAIMASMQTVQNRQNSMLLKQAREAQRQLPAPEGEVVDLGFQFDEALFDDIEME